MSFLGLLLLCLAAIHAQVDASVVSSESAAISTDVLQLPPTTCEYPGLQCTSCSQLSLCVETNTGLVEFAAETCDASIGSFCSYSLRDCSTNKSYCSLGAQFQCWDIGMFPDPFDCNVYYNCTSTEDGELRVKRHICGENAAYNAKTYQCDLRDSDDICEGPPLPECPDSEFSVGVVPQNPNLYYVCEKGLPQLFKCLAGEDYVFDPALYKCVRDETETTTITTTTTTQDPEANCTYGIFHPVPYTCYQYYFCTNMPSPAYTGHCPDDQYFDRDRRDCVKGKCPYPDEWKLVCPTLEDRNIPVPKVCNMYYYCGTIHTINQVTKCYNYFDRDLGKCAIGDCPYSDL